MAESIQNQPESGPRAGWDLFNKIWSTADGGVSIWVNPDFHRYAGNSDSPESEEFAPIRIIGVSGLAGAGKDTCYGMLENTIKDKSGRKPSIHKAGMADPFKEWGETFFTREQLYDPELKNKVDAFWGVSPRKWMQDMGEHEKSLFGQDVWAKVFYLRGRKLVGRNSWLICTDVRRDVEADCMHRIAENPETRDMRLQAVNIEIIRTDHEPPEDITSHISEVGVTPSKLDFRIVTNGNLTNLETAVYCLTDLIAVT